ncbi:MAG: LysR family transcriptional regulator, partial [Oscillospiraceae bacterium]|nr:LysR family transcriptional regulator [Oscillospiraceae bacterium]
METEKVSVLLGVIEAGSLSAAAEKLRYTPSGLSRMLAALEEETGFPLLRRGRWGVTPTAECRELLPQMRRLVQAEEQYREQAAALRGLEAGRLSIGSSYGIYYRSLAKLAADFCRLHPGIRVDLVGGSSTELARAVLEGRVDLCIISRRDGGFDWLGLRDDPLVAVLPPEHPCAGDAAYPLRRFAQDPFIEIRPGKETDNSRCFL